MFENIVFGVVLVSLGLIGLNVYLHARFEKNIKEFLKDAFNIQD